MKTNEELEKEIDRFMEEHRELLDDLASGLLCPGCRKVIRGKFSNLGEKFNWAEGCASCAVKTGTLKLPVKVRLLTLKISPNQVVESSAVQSGIAIALPKVGSFFELFAEPAEGGKSLLSTHRVIKLDSSGRQLVFYTSDSHYYSLELLSEWSVD
jgi:hypothetical protein